MTTPPVPPSGVVELFLDRYRILDASGGVLFDVVAPTKDTTNNPLLPVAGTNTDTWDYQKTYNTVIKDGATWRLWYGAYSIGANYLACYATSTDGIAWTKPNLGVVTYGGNTNNNIIHLGDSDHVYYDADLGLWVMVADTLNGVSYGVYIFTASNPQGPYTQVKLLAPSGYGEGKAITRRSDGRWLAYYTRGHGGDNREIGAFLSDTDDLDGSWQELGTLQGLGSGGTTNQVYYLGVQRISDYYVGFAARYNSTTELIWIDLFVSRDGLFWSQVEANWLPLGSSGTWDDSMLFASSLIADGDNWRLFYAGSADNHGATPPRDSRIGRAVVSRGRLGKISGFGTLLTTQVTPDAGSTLMVNADASTGGSATVTETYEANGTYQEFAVPAGITTISADLYGAQGGPNGGGFDGGASGGRVKCDVTVTPGETLRVYVGTKPSTATGGFNGGGGGGGTGTASDAGGGGGATDIRRSPYALADRLVVAGGGGGVGGNTASITNSGGTGGTPNGGTGTTGTAGQGGGGGGTQSAGGTAGDGSVDGSAGSLGQGGAGAATQRGGGGGGGGYYGGGGGGASVSSGTTGGGGGGGSGLSTGTNETLQSGVRTGHGYAEISYAVSAASGALDIEILDALGDPLTGYTEADFDTITTDDLDHSPTWGGNPMPTGQTIQLKFILTSATVYSYTIT